MISFQGRSSALLIVAILERGSRLANVASVSVWQVKLVKDEEEGEDGDDYLGVYGYSTFTPPPSSSSSQTWLCSHSFLSIYNL